ncbi:MAG TPA: pitrilysin family protein [Vicinamibacterales bacterium]|nr:pitrilysin family protein [Vicinamibacterales bacterium]
MAASALDRGLSPSRAVFDNGVVVLVQPNATTPAVAVNATFYTGCQYEPPDLPGVAYLTARLLDRGTERRSAAEIAEVLDDRGVALRIWAARHAFTLSYVCLTDDFDVLLEVASEVLRWPSFPEDELEKRRIEAITAVRQDYDSTAVRSAQAAVEDLYGPDHLYGRPSKGRIAALERIGRADIAAYHRSAVVPSALRLAIVGDVAAEAAIDLAARVFDAWRGAPPPDEPVPPPPRTHRSVRFVSMPGKSQSDIAYGFTTIRRVDPRYYAYWMLNNILGQFGLGGRLADNIRERQGMAYYAYSTLDATVGEGPLLIRAGVDPSNVERAVEAIDHEVRGLCVDGPTFAEVEDTRESLIGSIPRLLETNESIADFLQSVEQFGLGLDFDRQLPGLLRQVTQDDVMDAAREVLNPARAAIGVAGADGPGCGRRLSPPPVVEAS